MLWKGFSGFKESEFWGRIFLIKEIIKLGKVEGSQEYKEWKNCLNLRNPNDREGLSGSKDS